MNSRQVKKFILSPLLSEKWTWIKTSCEKQSQAKTEKKKKNEDEVQLEAPTLHSSP